MPLISCKVELKLEWTRQCVLAAAGIDNVNANDDNIIFTIKGKELQLLQSLYQQKTRKIYQNFLAKDLKGQCIEMNRKQKMKIKIRQMSIDILLNENSQVLTDCLFQFIQSR